MMRLILFFVMLLHACSSFAQYERKWLYVGEPLPASYLVYGNEFHVQVNGGLHGIGAQSTFSFDESHFIHISGNTLGRPSPQNGRWQRYGEISVGYFDPMLALKKQFNAFAIGLGAGNAQGVDSLGDYSYDIRRYFIEAHLGGESEPLEAKFILRTGYAQVKGRFTDGAAIVSCAVSGGIGWEHLHLNAQFGFDLLVPAPSRFYRNQFPVVAAAGIEYIIGRKPLY